MDEPGEHGQVVRGVCDGVPVEAEQVWSGGDRVGDQAADDRLHPVQPVGERRRDAEVAAPAAECPKQIPVRSRVGAEDVAFGGDQLDG